MIPRDDWRTAALVVLAAWIVYVSSPVAPSHDSRWSVPVALSLIQEGDLDLDEYSPQLETERSYLIQHVGGHIYTYHPMGTALLATPFVFMIERALILAQPVLRPIASQVRSPMVRAVLSADLVNGYPIVEVLISSFFTALTAAVMYLIARRFIPRTRALLLTLIFAFGTLSWSTVSRGLWAHSPSQFLLAVALLLLLLGDRYVPAAGLPLAVAYVVRPTNVIPAVLLSLFIAVYHRSQLRLFILWCLPVLIAFAALNWEIYRTILPPYFSGEQSPLRNFGFHSRLMEALAGQLISPARGLFVYSPVFLLSIYGMLLPLKEAQPRRLRPFLCVIVLLHYGMISLYPDWKGGHSIGSRYFSDLTPLFVYFLIPVFLRSGPSLAALALLSVPAILINGRCGTGFACHQWNIMPNDINHNESRLWDWHDPPFLR